MSERPRRSTRPIYKATPSSASSATKPKRVSQPAPDPAEVLKILLESPKSVLTRIDISEVFNVGAWEMLSEESRTELSRLLPSTTFVAFQPSLGPLHPAASDTMDVDQDPSSGYVADPALVFNNPHFLAAANTFQDHLFSGWLSPSHQEKVHRFQQRISEGSLTAQWKDDAWLATRDESESVLPAAANLDPNASSGSLLGLAGGAAQIKLTALVREGIIQIGDILAYRRNFTNTGISVDKDVIIHKIDPKTHALHILTEPGTASGLPDFLLQSELPDDPSHPTSELTNITSPTMLESGLLDVDGRVEKLQRPNGNAWKAFTVWRRRVGSDTSADVKRGGRENHGTLFYLRSVYYNES